MTKSEAEDELYYAPLAQVAYVPPHARGNKNHPDVIYGFVTSDPGKEFVFVRYWVKGREGEKLRDVAHIVSRKRLIPYDKCTEKEVKAAWKILTRQKK
jgi:hypothetical protein